MPERLYIDPIECTGCRVCEQVCAFKKEGVINPEKSRIRVHREEPGIDLPIACKQCEKASCIESCPVDALRRDENGVIQVDGENCIGCGACTEACPFGAIWLHPDNGKAIKCDNCGLCVESCPVGALQIIDTTGIAEKKRSSLIKEIETKLTEETELPPEV